MRLYEPACLSDFCSGTPTTPRFLNSEEGMKINAILEKWIFERNLYKNAPSPTQIRIPTVHTPIA